MTVISVENVATHTHHLADAGVSGKDIGVLSDGESRWAAVRDLEDTPPLGEITTVLLVLGAALRQAIKTCSGTTSRGMLRLELLLLRQVAEMCQRHLEIS